MEYRRVTAADMAVLKALRLAMLNEEKPLTPSLQGEIAAHAADYMETGIREVPWLSGWRSKRERSWAWAV